MISWRWQLWFGVVCYGVFLFAQLPARWVFGRIEPFVAPVRVTGLSGSIWSGRFVTLEWGAARVGPGSWRFVFPFPGESGPGIDFLVGDEEAGLHARGRAGVAGVSALFVEGAVLKFSVAALRERIPMIPPGSRGSFQATLEELRVDGQGVRAARGRGEARDWFIGAPLRVEIGDLAGEIAPGEGHSLQLRVQELAGPWRMKLVAGLKPDGSYRVRGTVAARDPTDERMLNLLRLVGPVDESGQAILRESGRLP
ncbi:MAG: type II secretion system protein N [Magnetococcales bacterium]|nr:type II secretion system protein N [Magnetococcales bacterium]